MPTPFQLRYWTNEAGQSIILGINNVVTDETIAHYELSDARNYIPDKLGDSILTKREGLSKVDSDSLAANASSIYQGRNATYVTAGTVTYDSGINSLDTGLTAGYPSWTSFATYDIMVNGSEARKTSDGSSFSALSNCPAGAKYVAAVNNFLYVAGHDKGKLRWANVGTAETWTATNELILTQDENDDITGLAPWENVLLVTCNKSFECISGYNTTEMGVSYYSKAAGCKSNRSIVVTPVGAFWWSEAGVVWVKKDFSIDTPMLRKIPATLNGLNRGNDSIVHSVHDPLQGKVMFYLFNGAAQSTINLRADYYYYDDAWYLHSGTGANMLSAALVFVSGQPTIYVSGYATTYLWKHALATTDDGTNISAYLKTHKESYPGALSRSDKAVLTTNIGTSSNVSYACWIDNGSSADTTWVLTPGTGTVDSVIGTNRQFYKLMHYIADSSAYSNDIYGLVHNGTHTRLR